MGLVSVDDLDARRIEYEDNDQAQAAIDDASSVARAYVAPVLDNLESPDTPGAIVVVVCSMVRRVLTNPNGLNMEVLGDYQYQTQNGVATLLPTTRERRLLRAAASAYAKAEGMDVPAFGVGAVYFQADLPGDC